MAFQVLDSGWLWSPSSYGLRGRRSGRLAVISEARASRDGLLWCWPRAQKVLVASVKARDSGAAALTQAVDIVPPQHRHIDPKGPDPIPSDARR